MKTVTDFIEIASGGMARKQAFLINGEIAIEEFKGDIRYCTFFFTFVKYGSAWINLKKHNNLIRDSVFLYLSELTKSQIDELTEPLIGVSDEDKKLLKSYCRR